MSNKAILVTVSGADRPGMVSALADVVAAYGGNWLESRMANLAGQFVGILRVDVDESRQDAMLEGLRKLDSAGLRVSLLPIDTPAQLSAGRDLELDLLGQDHPGIVRDISRVLSASGVSVQAFDSCLEDASMAGGVLFRAHARLRVPEHMSTDQLHEQLLELSDSLMVDIRLVDLDS